MDIKIKKMKADISIRQIIYTGMVVITILLFGFCIFFINSVWMQLNRHETSAYTDMLQLQVKMIESEIDKMQDDVVSIAVNDENLAYIRNSKKGEDYAFQKIQLNSHLREFLNTYSYVNGLFVIDEKNQNIIIQYDNDSTYTDMTDVKNYFMNREDIWRGEVKAERKFMASVGSSCFYFYILPIGNMYIGGWCNLQEQFPFVNDDNYPFTGIEYALGNEKYQVIDKEESYVSVQATGEVTGIAYMLHLSRSELYNTVFHLMGWEILITIFIFGVVIVVLLWISRRVLAPISYMEKELEVIGAGNLEHRLEKKGDVREFQMLYGQFNEMLDQVSRLKIQIYEEQMARQEIYTAYLTMQMNPHFYVNSLNVIHSLTKIKNYSLAEKMTSCLSEYLNYMFRKEKSFATIEEELAHVDNFIEIQRIRYAENFLYNTEVEEGVKDAKIPILLFHTFVENSVKHSKTKVENLKICIQVSSARDGWIKAVCVDNGEGFDSQMAEKLNAHERIVKEDGEHIGIRNLRERAYLFFNNEFSIDCSNNETGGARIRVEFPYYSEKEER